MTAKISITMLPEKKAVFPICADWQIQLFRFKHPKINKLRLAFIQTKASALHFVYLADNHKCFWVNLQHQTV